MAKNAETITFMFREFIQFIQIVLGSNGGAVCQQVVLGVWHAMAAKKTLGTVNSNHQCSSPEKLR